VRRQRTACGVKPFSTMTVVYLKTYLSRNRIGASNTLAISNSILLISFWAKRNEFEQQSLETWIAVQGEVCGADADLE
jgi:hypothetical protein